MAMNKTEKKRKVRNNLKEALRQLLTEGITTSQEEICNILKHKGHEVDQSKISRLLHKLGAVKILDTTGKMTYRLPQESLPPSTNTALSNLVTEVIANETLIAVHTNPGSAALVARLLDYNRRKLQILGTVAGDDVIFVAPQTTKNTGQSLSAIKKLLEI